MSAGEKAQSQGVVNTPATEEKEEYVWIKWEKKYEIGIPVIDKQHHHLVDLCNKLRRDLKNFSTADGVDWHVTLGNTLKELVAYTQQHFAAEEKLMKLCNYERFDTHVRQHRDFVSKVTESLMTFDLTTLQHAFTFLDFLRDWILSHVACEDKLYVKPILDYYRALQSS